MRIGLLLFGALVISRLLPLPANSEPLLGLAVLSPHLSKNLFVWFVPLLVMLVSDMIIGFHNHMVFTYTALGVAPLISKLVKHKYMSLLYSWLVWHILANYGMYYPPFSAEALIFDIRFLLSGLVIIVVYDLTFHANDGMIVKMKD